jgi:transposase
MPACPLAARNARCASPGCWCRDRSARYPSDLDDSQWRVLEPEARVVMAELTRASGRPMAHELRAVCDAVFYVVKNGIEWRELPADFPPWEPECPVRGSRGVPGSVVDHDCHRQPLSRLRDYRRPPRRLRWYRLLPGRTARP